MKRAGNLYAKICEPDNLRRAFLKARQGKQRKPDVVEFSNQLHVHLLEIRAQLLDESITFGPYNHFIVHEPKERVICVAPFVDRVVHHAILNVCEPCFEAYQISDSYACRKGKGSYAALDRAKGYSMRYRWYLKLDVRKYFDSISHRCLIPLLRRRFKEKQLQALLERIVESHGSAKSGCGLPIGNLTSQFFANHYLAVADHFVKETLRCRAYVRYMDDMVLWGDDRDGLIQKAKRLTEFVGTQLDLTLRPWCMNRSSEGLPFLGYMVHEGSLFLSRRANDRYRVKLKQASMGLASGVLSEDGFEAHVQSLLAFRSHAKGAWGAENLVSFSGFEPRETRRQLEQQRPELPLGESQQQQPEQPQQQHRFSGLLRSPSSKEQTDVTHEPNGACIPFRRDGGSDLGSSYGVRVKRSLGGGVRWVKKKKIELRGFMDAANRFCEWESCFDSAGAKRYMVFVSQKSDEWNGSLARVCTNGTGGEFLKRI